MLSPPWDEITTSYHSISTPFPRHCRRPSLPNGPFVQHKWEALAPIAAGPLVNRGGMLRGSSCIAALRLRQLDIDVTPVS